VSSYTSALRDRGYEVRTAADGATLVSMLEPAVDQHGLREEQRLHRDPRRFDEPRAPRHGT
jgi:hypothetical protein